MEMKDIEEYQQVYKKECMEYKKLLIQDYYESVLSVFPKDYSNYQYLATIGLQKYIEICMDVYIQSNLSRINCLRGTLSIKEYKNIEDKLRKIINKLTKGYEIHSYKELQTLIQSLEEDKKIKAIVKDAFAGGDLLIGVIADDLFFNPDWRTSDPDYIKFAKEAEKFAQAHVDTNNTEDE